LIDSLKANWHLAMSGPTRYREVVLTS